MGRDNSLFLYLHAGGVVKPAAYIISYGVMVTCLILVQKIVVRAHVGKQNGVTSNFDELPRFYFHLPAANTPRLKLIAKAINISF
jgi:hypothetical protein